MFQKTKQNIWVRFRTPFRTLCRNDPEQNAGTIHPSNPEHLPVLKAPRGDDPEQNTSLILRIYAGPILNRTRGQSTRPIRNTSLLLRLFAGPIRNRMRGRSMRQILVFKAPCGDDPEHNALTIHASNWEHLLGVGTNERPCN